MSTPPCEKENNNWDICQTPLSVQEHRVARQEISPAEWEVRPKTRSERIHSHALPLSAGQPTELCRTLRCQREQCESYVNKYFDLTCKNKSCTCIRPNINCNSLFRLKAFFLFLLLWCYADNYCIVALMEIRLKDMFCFVSGNSSITDSFRTCKKKKHVMQNYGRRATLFDY